MDVGEAKKQSGGDGGSEDGITSHNYELLTAKTHVMITDVTMSNGASPRMSPKSGENKSSSSSSSSPSMEKKASGKMGESEENKFFIEEPFDFVFEPDHYPKESAEKKAKLSNEEESENAAETTTTTTTTSGRGGNQHKYAQVVRELDDGMLEYEYKSFTYDRAFYTNKLNDDLDSLYFQEFNSHLHMRAAESLIRGVSLSRWPHVGFGFELATARIGAEPLLYVNRIEPDSPAALSSLRLGDVLIEVDDETPCFGGDGDGDEAVLKRVADYVAARDNLHLMVVHETQYVRLKADDDFLLKNYYFNCEDIVVVNVHNKKLVSID